MTDKNKVITELKAYMYKDGSFTFDWGRGKGMSDAQLLYVAEAIKRAVDSEIDHDSKH